MFKIPFTPYIQWTSLNVDQFAYKIHGKPVLIDNKVIGTISTGPYSPAMHNLFLFLSCPIVAHLDRGTLHLVEMVVDLITETKRGPSGEEYTLLLFFKTRDIVLVI